MCFNLKNIIVHANLLSSVTVPLRRVSGPLLDSGGNVSHMPVRLEKSFPLLGNKEERTFFLRDIPYPHGISRENYLKGNGNYGVHALQSVPHKSASVTILNTKSEWTLKSYVPPATQPRYLRIILGGNINERSAYHYNYDYTGYTQGVFYDHGEEPLFVASGSGPFPPSNIRPRMDNIRSIDVQYSFAEINFRDKTFSIGSHNQDKDTFFQTIDVSHILTGDPATLDLTLFDNNDDSSELAAKLNNVVLSHVDNNLPNGTFGIVTQGLEGDDNILKSTAVNRRLIINSLGQRSQNNKFERCSSAYKQARIYLEYPDNLRFFAPEQIKRFVEKVNTVYRNTFNLEFVITSMVPVTKLNNIKPPKTSANDPAITRCDSTGINGIFCYSMVPSSLSGEFCGNGNDDFLVMGCARMPGFKGWSILSTDVTLGAMVLAHELGHNLNASHENNNFLMTGNGLVLDSPFAFSSTSQAIINSHINANLNIFTNIPEKPVYTPPPPPTPIPEAPEITPSVMSKVPLEDLGDSGTVNRHWEDDYRDESYFGGDGLSYPGVSNELMVGSISSGQPRILSKLSIGSLVDFGYIENNPGSSEGDPNIVNNFLVQNTLKETSINLNCKCDLPNNKVGTINILSKSDSIKALSSPILFDKSSWASVVPEPYKTYLDEAADRWSLYMSYNSSVVTEIRSFDGFSTWNGLALNPSKYTIYNDVAVKTIASSGPWDYVDLQGVQFNSLTFQLNINNYYLNLFSRSDWINIMTHELGHALGIGIYWDPFFQAQGAVPPNNYFLDGNAYVNCKNAYLNIISSPPLPTPTPTTTPVDVNIISSVRGVVLSIDVAGNLRVNNEPIRYEGRPVNYNYMQSTGFTALAAANINGVNRLVWRTSAGLLHHWRLNSNWEFNSSFGWQAVGSKAYNQSELAFGLDFDGDGNILLSTVRETTLILDVINDQLRANGQIITFEGRPVNYKYMESTGFTALAAANINGVNRLVWRTSTGLLHHWRLNANWEFSSSFGWQAVGSKAYNQSETAFNIDFDRNGIIGSGSLAGSSANISSLSFTNNLPSHIFVEFDKVVELSVSFDILDSSGKPVNDTTKLSILADCANQPESLCYEWQSKRSWDSDFVTIPSELSTNNILRQMTSGLDSLNAPSSLTDDLIYEDIRCIIKINDLSITSNVCRLKPRPPGTNISINRLATPFFYVGSGQASISVVETFQLDDLPIEIQKNIQYISQGTSTNPLRWFPKYSSDGKLLIRDQRQKSDFFNLVRPVSGEYNLYTIISNTENSPYFIDLLPSNFSFFDGALSFLENSTISNDRPCFSGKDNEWNIAITNKIQNFMLDKDISIPTSILEEYPLIKQVYGYDSNNKFMFWGKNYPFSNLKFLTPNILYTIISEEANYNISYNL
jgi:hypothetical protein